MSEGKADSKAPKQAAYNKNEKQRDVRSTNIQAAKGILLGYLAVADCIRTSLGPRGMDKMIRDGRGETLITNDGATILQKMDVVHPTAKMVHSCLFSWSKSRRPRMWRLEMVQHRL